MRWIRSGLAFAAAVLMILSAPAFAQTLYKLIDKNGKVTYSETPPKDFDGKVIRVDIDPKANTATLPKPGPDEFRPAGQASPAAANRLAEARERLAGARKALADAKENPREEDVQWVGNKGAQGGGVRAVPTEAYEKRLRGLEEAVKAAETEVERAGGTL